jgi:hypothetical protein
MALSCSKSYGRNRQPSQFEIQNSSQRNSVPRGANHVCEYLRCTKTAQISTRNDLRLLSAVKKS